VAQFQFKDVCYPSEVAALQAFKSHFDFTLEASPSATVPYSWSLTSATVSTTGLITYALKRSAGTTTLIGQTHQLQACDEMSLNSVFDKMPQQDMLFVMALAVVFVLGFGQGRG